ncbi:hypothetical protein J437_LFUL006807 [Ladona fulva]|uniref:Uncharacterized protein n=1 Tax=Ladona fulva TaxID=123851 RepID=A0A8K0K5Z8_LADFU|nr:hypothetical protein J437_LFUL006807 [Ladona fulva]
MEVIAISYKSITNTNYNIRVSLSNLPLFKGPGKKNYSRYDNEIAPYARTSPGIYIRASEVSTIVARVQNDWMNELVSESGHVGAVCIPSDTGLATQHHLSTRWSSASALVNGCSQVPGHAISNGWIGRGGPIAWPPRSPDITPLDFFFWGFVKDRVYATKADDIPMLRCRITDAIATVTEDMLRRTWQEIEYRLNILRATNGSHVEVNTPELAASECFRRYDLSQQHLTTNLQYNQT